ncbi:hypothetical protein S7335_3361 [Synechococcus sp. PCC 7335]|uniref:hypothetical protein n=1 Tax=Synechococcus sp. (strain ATCC 29403 / PCC 7335) TaxID=91464 RepID=UPI00017ED578|nr:hypothetical protein [Synechococcus sp. PCC 7335]EDX85658.1 hypothetical protein S7335_3361 [Synechococcus sp. PCC 7335]
MSFAFSLSIILIVVAAGISLTKLVFLLWLLIRTKRLAVLAYMIYLVSIAALGNFGGEAIASVFSPTVQPDAWQVSMLALNMLNALVETTLFVWLLWPLFQRTNRNGSRYLANDTADEQGGR